MSVQFGELFLHQLKARAGDRSEGGSDESFASAVVCVCVCVWVRVCEGGLSHQWLTSGK